MDIQYNAYSKALQQMLGENYVVPWTKEVTDIEQMKELFTVRYPDLSWEAFNKMSSRIYLKSNNCLNNSTGVSQPLGKQ
jgi:hypothetical protein